MPDLHRPALVRPIGLALALLALIAACSPPQDVANVHQVVAGEDKPDATFAVQAVSRATLPMLIQWPNSHPTANLGWITHQNTSADPVIRSGDMLSLAVWDNDDTSLLSSPGQKVTQLPNLQVSSSGTIFVPYVNEVYVAKMTPDEARKAIQTKLLLIIPSAQVLLTYASGVNNSVEVVSGLAVNGKIPLIDRSTTVTSILAQAGGIPTAMPNPQVNLQRGGRLYRIAADTLLAHPELDTTLRGGDKVFIQPEDRYFLSLGAAGRQALINFPRDEITTLDAMSIIGGLNASTANPKGILILRDYPAAAVHSDGKKGPPKDRMIFAFNLTTADGLFSAGEFKIQDRDLVLVTQSPMVNTRTIVSFIGSVIGAGKGVASAVNSVSN